MSFGPSPNVAGGLVMAGNAAGPIAGVGDGSAGGGAGCCRSDCGNGGGGAPGGGGSGGGGITPPPPPGSGAPYAQTAIVHNPISPLDSLDITCANTGVTLHNTCSGATFYHDTAGAKTYSTPGGTARACAPLGPNTQWGPGTASGDVPDPVGILVYAA